MDLVEERRLARERGDFKRADEIRATIEAAGYEVRDRPDGTTRLYARRDKPTDSNLNA
jgi:cysteinyl-tRNA synthetase